MWRSALLAAPLDALSLAVSLAAAASLFRLGAWADPGAPLLKELIGLGAAALCTLASWGFFRFLIDVLRHRGLSPCHPGHVAWWLAGGIWVAGCAVDLVFESSPRGVYAVLAIIHLGTLVAMPLVAALLVACLGSRERARADWRAWAGFLAGLSVPFAWVLSIVGRL